MNYFNIWWVSMERSYAILRTSPTRSEYDLPIENRNIEHLRASLHGNSTLSLNHSGYFKVLILSDNYHLPQWTIEPTVSGKR
jgi:hypothetical protein